MVNCSRRVRTQVIGTGMTPRVINSFLGVVAAVVLLLTSVSASAQELEPGACWPMPNGLNITTVINNFNWGASWCP